MDPSTNGVHQGPSVDVNGLNQNAVGQIIEALEVVHGSNSTNEARKQASAFLQQTKADPTAPLHGFALASQKEQSPLVRHYALSLLEHSIRHNWDDLTLEQAGALRGWIIQLSSALDVSDPSYIRNKTAQLWVEIAKRSWGGEDAWVDMDEQLVRLWSGGSIIHKEFVLFVLETLSEDVFNSEDTTVGLRGAELSKACVDIFTPVSVLAEHFSGREKKGDVRYGDEGWLVRLGVLLESCLASNVNQNEEARECACRTLSALKAALAWAIPKAIVAARCVEHICAGLASGNVKVQMVRTNPQLLNLSEIDNNRSEFCRSLTCLV
jgi:exportin-5